eukprot:TRINITY_DN4386_c0_g3_i1.p4 TRINITY_DN4386_c0_g3~~TRINITY_DN4386_c0_g3_i1.p4  ORF type:complete len:116 (+),score=19.71 TRINITY_DN4386_c0_g3_i1:649-996(+)
MADDRDYRCALPAGTRLRPDSSVVSSRVGCAASAAGILYVLLDCAGIGAGDGAGGDASHRSLLFAFNSRPERLWHTTISDPLPSCNLHAFADGLLLLHATKILGEGAGSFFFFDR